MTEKILMCIYDVYDHMLCYPDMNGNAQVVVADKITRLENYLPEQGCLSDEEYEKIHGHEVCVLIHLETREVLKAREQLSVLAAQLDGILRMGKSV